jgi:hypothetical protein
VTPAGTAGTLAALAEILAAAGRSTPPAALLDTPGAAVWTLGIPRPGEVGYVEDLLVDRCFGPDGPRHAVELATLADLAPRSAQDLEDAVTAAALARAHGVPADAVRAGLRAAAARHAPDVPVPGAVATDDGPMAVESTARLTLPGGGEPA